jgi:hypothetical protein
MAVKDDWVNDDVVDAADLNDIADAVNTNTAALPSKIETVTYNGTTVTVSAARPTADAVYWVDFPSAPVNAESQDIVEGAIDPKLGNLTGLVNLHYTDKPIVTVRLDDSTTADYAVANLLTARGLVGTFALIWARVQAGTGTTIANYLEMQKNGHQIAAHSRTTTSHAAPPTDFAVFFDEIVTMREEMMAVGLVTDHWVSPGPWSTPDNPFYFDSYAKLDGDPGRLLQQTYHTSNAYMNTQMTGARGENRPIPAMTRHGAMNYQWETNTLTDVTNKIEQLKSWAQPSSIQVLTHPSVIDTAGKVTTTTYTAFLDYLVAQRDAGNLYVMTESAALLARPGTRINLLGDPEFEKYTASAATSPWLVASSPPTSVTGESGNAVSLVAGINGGVHQYVRAADGLRSMEVTGRFQRISGTSPAVARIVVQYTGGVGVSTQVDKQVSISTTGVWTTVRATFGVVPGITQIKVWFMNNTTGAVMALDKAKLTVT